MSFLSWFKLKCSVHCLLIIKASQIPTYTLRCPLINDVTARSTQKAPMSAFKKSCRYLISISAQYSSLERFSENFDEKAETYLIFFLGMHWFQKCNSLSPFWGRWGRRGQTTSKPKMTKIQKENLSTLDEIQIWPQRPRKWPLLKKFIEPLPRLLRSRGHFWGRWSQILDFF